jgi:DNA-binding MarR family transcriptional regulator
MPRRATGLSLRPEPLAETLHAAAIHLLRRLRREDTATGLGPARLSALSVLVFGGPMRISDLARAEQVRTPTITPIVAALEQAGLIARDKDERDARASVVRATARGRRLMEEGRARRVATLAADLRRLTARDRLVLARAAALIHELGRPKPGDPS